MSGFIEETSLSESYDEPTLSFADDSGFGTPLRIRAGESYYQNMNGGFDSKNTRLIIEENNNNNEKVMKEKEHCRLKRSLSKRVWSLPKRQLVFLLLIMFGNFLFSACYSLLATFFPKEAERKGASSTECGLVFGIYQLIIFFACPVFGKLVPFYSITFLLNSSVFVVGTCSVLFGFIDGIEGGAKFIAFAFAIRIVEALGTALFYTATYAAVPEEFPHNPTTVYSLLETSFGLGMITGPSIGGALYQIGGFMTPFVVIGCFLLFVLLLNVCAIGNPDEESKDVKVDMCKVISDAGFVNDILLCISYCIVIGFNEATLEKHLRQFDLNHIVLGTMFIISGAMYAISTIFWGFLCDMKMDAHLIGAFGCGICATSYLMIGPAPFFDSPTYISLVVLAQLLIGCGTGAQVICAYVHSTESTIKRGFSDSTATYAAVSGILNSFTALGSFIGPSAAGFLLEWFSYRQSTVFVCVTEAIIAITIVMLRLLSKLRANAKDEEKRRLLPKTKTTKTYVS